MIRIIEAIEYRGIAVGGRNEPLQVMGEDQDGTPVELYLKPSGRPELNVESLANELLAAIVAGALNLPICEPLLVEMSQEWIDSIQDHNLRAVLNASNPIAFGSRNAGVGWQLWSTGDRILGERRQKALAIFAFDAFTGNPDRRDTKPNLLVRGEDFRIIDHEFCFGIRTKLFPKIAPWELGNLSNLVYPEHHVLGPLLRGDRFIDIDALREPWAAISDDRLEEFETCIPQQWAAAAQAMSDALEHVKIVRDRIDDCLAEIERVLT